jgi:hypothetical protein
VAPETKPYLLLDVDGTLSPIPGPNGYPEGVDWFPPDALVQFDTRLPEWLDGLACLFELAWATTWNDLANQMVSPLLGLPDLPTVSFAGDRPPFPRGPGMRSRKLPWVAQFIADRPAAWIDDWVDPAARRWARERAQPTLFLATNKYVGITERHVRKLHRWAQTVTTAP